MVRPFGTKKVSLDKIKQILELRDTLSITEISIKLNIPRTTVHRYLTTYA